MAHNKKTNGLLTKKTYKITKTSKSVCYYLDAYLHRDDGPAFQYIDNNIVKEEQYMINGQLHRENGPAHIYYYGSGKVKLEYYYLNGKKLNPNGNEVNSYYESGSLEYYENSNNDIKSIFYYENGTIRTIVYNRHDQGLNTIHYREDASVLDEIYKKGEDFHRVDLPAVIEYYPNGDVKSESYYLDGKLHNLNGPSIIAYSISRKITTSIYYVNGKLHRVDGPAWYCLENHGHEYKYYINGKLHREKGPAEFYIYDGKEIPISYALNGKKYKNQQGVDDALLRNYFY